MSRPWPSPRAARSAAREAPARDVAPGPGGAPRKGFDSLQIASEPGRYVPAHASLRPGASAPAGARIRGPGGPSHPSMPSTLIVRDATLAINGGSDPRTDFVSHLNGRLEEVAQFEAEIVEDCAETLATSDSEEADPDALRALVTLCLAHPDVCAKHKVTPSATGRRLAVRLVKQGRSEDAVALLELLL